MAATQQRQTTSPPDAPATRGILANLGPAAVALALAAVVAVLSFADRAPGIMRNVFGSLGRLSNSAENATGVDLPDTNTIPYAWDTIGHFGLWAALATVTMWAVRRRIPALTVGIWLFALSAAAEVGQGYLATNRTPDLGDLVANGFGIAAGVGAVLLLRSVAAMARRFAS